MPHQCTSCDRVFPDGSSDVLSGCPDCDNNTFRYLPDEIVERAESGNLAQDAEEVPPRNAAGKSPEDATATPSGDAGGQESSVSGTVGHVATTLMDFVSENADDAEQLEGVETDAALLHGEDAEDSAQSSARSTIVSREELPEDAARLVRTDPGAGGAILDGEIAVGGTGIAGKDEASGEGGTEDATATSPEPAAGEAATGDGASRESLDLEELRAELNEQFEGIRVVEPGRYELNIMQLYEREETIIALKEDGRYVIDVPDSWLAEDESE